MTKEPIVRSGKNKEADDLMVTWMTIGDTTWRMFVPSISFTLIGVWLDSVFATKPWLMFGGIILGFFGAYLLVANQIKAVKRERK